MVDCGDGDGELIFPLWASFQFGNVTLLEASCLRCWVHSSCRWARLLLPSWSWHLTHPIATLLLPTPHSLFCCFWRANFPFTLPLVSLSFCILLSPVLPAHFKLGLSVFYLMARCNARPSDGGLSHIHGHPMQDLTMEGFLRVFVP